MIARLITAVSMCSQLERWYLYIAADCWPGTCLGHRQCGIISSHSSGWSLSDQMV